MPCSLTHVSNNSFCNGLNGNPQNVIPTLSAPVPMKVTLLGARVFAAVVKDLGVRAFFMNGLGPKYNDKCAYKRQERGKDTERRGEGPVKVESEIGRCGHKPGKPRSPQQLEEARTLVPQDLQKACALQTP